MLIHPRVPAHDRMNAHGPPMTAHGGDGGSGGDASICVAVAEAVVVVDARGTRVVLAEQQLRSLGGEAQKATERSTPGVPNTPGGAGASGAGAGAVHSPAGPTLLAAVEVPKVVKRSGLKMCETCHLKQPSFGLPGLKRRQRWCAACAKKEKNAVSLDKMCEGCSVKHANFGIRAASPNERSRKRWCGVCAKGHQGAVNLFTKMCEDCGQKQPHFGMPPTPEQQAAPKQKTNQLKRSAGT